ncbi:secondary thiamine-phosphate synthase enzyme YjbQ [Cyanobium sp. T1B-Tous]|uniref:secondary thiamine-phosphate synthase enzyme YjbQ n=1 Tax=Cyanobium sp. T1B-Tous TaxID=2823721 RepID=UPI0020CC83E5|nr:secondary thiamine-phosphate synthase enzyme YjbQ [Cyanobium sp. T1B-Tous]MCP9806373.1 secondary thiamine-phosphate synthase enzyme YjbQ [Cyanobium sp. T1B-Tous]
MLRQTLQTLQVATSGEGFTDLTAPLHAAVAASGLQLGLLNLVCLHTSCSLTINENADPRVLADLAAHLRALVPEEGIRPVSGRGELRPYVHADEGSDDMPAHIRTALTTSQLSLSFQNGRLLLGTWQAVYLWEHRRRGSRRQLSLHLLGS